LSQILSFPSIVMLGVRAAVSMRSHCNGPS
jgi:hypothetical protein